MALVRQTIYVSLVEKSTKDLDLKCTNTFREVNHSCSRLYCVNSIFQSSHNCFAVYVYMCTALSIHNIHSIICHFPTLMYWYWVHIILEEGRTFLLSSSFGPTPPPPTSADTALPLPSLLVFFSLYSWYTCSPIPKVFYVCHQRA